MNAFEIVKRIGVNYTKINRAIERYVKEKYGVQLSINEINSICKIVQMKDTATTTYLSKELSMGPPQVSNLLKRLEQRDFIFRETDKLDRRKVYIKPKEFALELCHGLMDGEGVVDQIFEDNLSNLDVTNLDDVSNKLEMITRRIECVLNNLC